MSLRSISTPNSRNPTLPSQRRTSIGRERLVKPFMKHADCGNFTVNTEHDAGERPSRLRFPSAAVRKSPMSMRSHHDEIAMLFLCDALDSAGRISFDEQIIDLDPAGPTDG